MRALRAGLVVAGVVCGLVGLYQLREESLDQLVSTGLWLAGGVALHDAVLAPLTVAVVLAGSRLAPRHAWGVLLVGFVGWATVTVASVNVLLGVGGKEDNATILNRPYLTWWLALSVLWWVGIALVVLRAGRRATPAADVAG